MIEEDGKLRVEDAYKIIQMRPGSCSDMETAKEFGMRAVVELDDEQFIKEIAKRDLLVAQEARIDELENLPHADYGGESDFVST